MSVHAAAPSRSLAGLRRPAPPGTRWIIASVAVAAAVVFVAALVSLTAASFGVGLLVLGLLAIFTEAFPVPLEGVQAGATTFSNVFIVAAGVIYGWQAGVLVAVVAMALTELYRWRPLHQQLFNTAIYTLAAAASGVAAAAVPSVGMRALAGSAAFYVVDVGLLCWVMSVLKQRPYPRVAAGFFRSTFLPFTVMAALAALLVHLWADGFVWAFLLAPPLLTIAYFERNLLKAFRRQRELDTLKDEFIATVSHELRTPLTSVYGSAVTLQRQGLDVPVAPELVGIIRRESSRLVKLVDDVLWASRIDRRQERGREQLLDIGEIVADATRTLQDFAPDNITIRCDSGSELDASIDPEHLRRVITNLVDNAVKYSPDGGNVLVSTHRLGELLRISVADEGIGIPAHECERVFDKFSRLDPDMRRGIGGTGLGLYICRELVRQMGGRIWCAPNAAGRGTTFSFEIAAAPEKGRQP